MDCSVDEENDPVRTFLKNAFLAKEHGNSFQYDVVVQQMRSREDPDTICQVVVAMENFSSYLSNRSDLFHELLNAIFSYDWTGEQRLNVATMDLIIAIISCNVTFAKLAYRGFVHTFFRPDLDQIRDAENEESSKQRFEVIHDGIRAISSQVPMSTNILFDELRANFPHKRFSQQTQEEYLRHCLRICDSIPRIRDKILDLVISKCLEIDVEIEIDAAGDAHIQQEDTSTNECLTSPDTNCEDLSRSFAESESKKLQDQSRTTSDSTVRDSAGKLDSMLSLLVDFVAAQAPSAKSTSSRSTSHYLDFWPILLKIFEKRLLLTHKSKFVQFVFFFATTSLQPDVFSESFCRRLLVIAFDLSAPINVRLSATMYLASFIARVNVLSLSIVRDILREVFEWCVMYVLVYRADPHYSSVHHPHVAPSTKLTTLSKKRLKKKFGKLREHAKEMLATAQQYQQQQWARQQHVNQQRSASRMSDGSSSVISSMSSLSPNNNPDGVDPQEQQEQQYTTVMELDEFGRLQVKDASIRQHIVFYAMVQALAYVFCFYGTDLVDLFLPSGNKSRNDSLTEKSIATKRKHSDDELSWLESATNTGNDKEEQSKHVDFLTGMEIIFGSRFDPLRYVMTSVRYEFFRLVIHRRLFPDAMWLRHLSPEIMAFENDLDMDDENKNVKEETAAEEGDDNVIDQDEQETGQMSVNRQLEAHRRRQAQQRNKIINNSILQHYYAIQRADEEARAALDDEEEEDENDNGDGERHRRVSGLSGKLGNIDDVEDMEDTRSVVSGLSCGSRRSIQSCFSTASMLSSSSRNSISTVAYAQSVWSNPMSSSIDGHDSIQAGTSMLMTSHYHQMQQQQYQEMMENFFPFDPCLLSGLHGKIASVYREWDGGVPGVPCNRQRADSLHPSENLHQTEENEAEDDEEDEEDEKMDDNDESIIDEDDEGRVLGDDEDIDSDDAMTVTTNASSSVILVNAAAASSTAVLLASGAVSTGVSVSTPASQSSTNNSWISRMDPSHPLSSGGFFFAGGSSLKEGASNNLLGGSSLMPQHTDQDDEMVEGKEGEEEDKEEEDKEANGFIENDEPAEKKKKKSKKDKKDKKDKRDKKKRHASHVYEENVDENMAVFEEEIKNHEQQDIVREEHDDEDEAPRKKKKKEDKKESKRERKEHKHDKKKSRDAISESASHLLPLTSSSLLSMDAAAVALHSQLHPADNSSSTSASTSTHFYNPVVDRFLREQQQEQDKRRHRKKSNSQQTSDGHMVSRGSKQTALSASSSASSSSYSLPVHAQYETPQPATAASFLSDLPQPELSPLQREQLNHQQFHHKMYQPTPTNKVSNHHAPQKMTPNMGNNSINGGGSGGYFDRSDAISQQSSSDWHAQRHLARRHGVDINHHHNADDESDGDDDDDDDEHTARHIHNRHEHKNQYPHHSDPRDSTISSAVSGSSGNVKRRVDEFSDDAMMSSGGGDLLMTSRPRQYSITSTGSW